MGHTANAPTAHLGSGFAPLNAQASLIIDPEDEIHVHVPPTRPDILHECDIMEDVAIAYGFDNLKRTFPQTNTVAKPLPVNKLTDVLRRLCTEASWTEVLPLILVRPRSRFSRTLSLLPTSDASPSLAVLARRELQVPKPRRPGQGGGRARQPQDDRVPDRAHVAPARPSQVGAREPQAHAPAAHFRGVGHRRAGPARGAPGAQRAPHGGRLLRPQGRVRGRARPARPPHGRPRRAQPRLRVEHGRVGLLHQGVGRCAPLVLSPRLPRASRS